MSLNNIREKIILAVIKKIESLSSIQSVIRNLPEDIRELGSVADTQIPLVSITAKLPKPEEGSHKNTRSTEIFIDSYQSILDISITCFYMETMSIPLDSIKGDLADDIFAALNENQTFGLGRVITDFKILNDIVEGFWKPYGAFQYTLRLKYLHSTGGF